MQEFSDLFVKNLKPKDQMYNVRESKGFGVRVLPSGVKTWFFIYQFDGKRKFLNLGQYPVVSLKKARERHRAAYGLWEDGKDPLTLRFEEKEARRKTYTVSKLIHEYREKHSKPNKKSWKEDERCLNKDIKPTWGDRKATDIKKRDIILLLESIIERGAPVQANNVLEKARKMFNFAVERDIIEYSPFKGVKPLTPKQSRERHLTAEEIKTLWQSIDRASMFDEIKRALKLILVTAQRPGEVIGLHSDEIEGRWWTIPAERAKNGKASTVYLTDLAVELIGERKGYIFESPRPITEPGKDPVSKPMDENALARAVRNNCPCEGAANKKVENKLGIAFFRPHDLRRTAATHMAELGISDEVIDAILNHVKKGVIRVYNLHKYDKEKQRALIIWKNRLNSIIKGEKRGKVINLQG